MTGNSDAILSVRGLTKHFPVRKGFFRKVVGQVQAVEDVSFEVRRGETLGLVGESGSGKTTLGRALVRLIAPTRGEIILNQSGKAPIDIAPLGARALKPIRRDCQIIFQDPRRDYRRTPRYSPHRHQSHPCGPGQAAAGTGWHE